MGFWISTIITIWINTTTGTGSSPSTIHIMTISDRIHQRNRCGSPAVRDQLWKPGARNEGRESRLNGEQTGRVVLPDAIWAGIGRHWWKWPVLERRVRNAGNQRATIYRGLRWKHRIHIIVSWLLLSWSDTRSSEPFSSEHIYTRGWLLKEVKTLLRRGNYYLLRRSAAATAASTHLQLRLSHDHFFARKNYLTLGV